MWLSGTFAAFGAAVAVHAVTVRLSRGSTIVLKFMSAGAIIGAGWLAVVWFREGWSIRFLTAALLYAFVCELYVFLITLVANSVAVSLLMSISAGCGTPEAVERAYRPDTMVRRRLGQLERSGLIDNTGGRLTLTAAGRRLIRTFDTVTGPIRPTGLPSGATESLPTS